MDEIEDMSPALQLKLLRVLQEKEIMHIGGDRIIKVDVRIIAATNQNLEELVRQGKIRKDLFYPIDIFGFKCYNDHDVDFILSKKSPVRFLSTSACG